MLTRETPPPASDLVSDDGLLENKLREKKIPDNLIKVVIGAMCPNVKKRIQNVREFAVALADSSTHTIGSSSDKPSEDETVVVKNGTKTTDGEETVVSNNSINNSNQSPKNEISYDYYDDKEGYEESSNKGIKHIISFLVVVAVILSFIFYGFRGCEVNHPAAPAANEDSDTVMLVDTAIDCDSVAMYVENKTEIFFGETVRYTGNEFTDP